MKPFKQLPPAEELRAAFSYDPESGELRKNGRLIQARSKNGYLVCRYQQQNFYAHRLIWKLVTGADPSVLIDHINRVRSDNSWENLRLTDSSGNTANRSHRNKHGMKGITKKANRYRAEIMRGGKRLFLGSFPTAEEAHQAFLDAGGIA